MWTTSKTACGSCAWKGKDGIARALYVTASGQRVVILRVFTKKTQKMPQREIKLALKRAEEVT